MKKTIAFLALVVATIGTAAAQGSRTGGGNTGTGTNGANANMNASSGNSSNTSSSAANNNPTTTAPNYKPAPGDKRTPSASNSKGSTKATSNQVVSSGGQGHNTTHDPKGKVLVAPSVTTGKNPK